MPRLPLLTAAGLAGLALLTGPAAAGQSLGFAISWLAPHHYVSADDCANGMNQELNWPDLLAKAGKTPAEIKELLRPEKMREFLQAILHRGPKGEDVCAEPWVDKHSPPWKTVTGKTAHGENMDGTTDGSATATTCAHEKFTTPDGKLADNQFYRLYGCSAHERAAGKATPAAYLVDRMREGALTMLLEITGIDDMKNDPEVEMTLYRGIEGLKKDASGEVMSNHTFHLYSNPNFQIRMKGAIKDGELTTQPTDIDMFINRVWKPPQMRLKSARFRVRFHENGMMKGTLASYRDIALEYFAAQKVKPLAEKNAGMNCPGFYKAIKALADGNRDPVTGECSSISAVDYVEAVPAFLIHQEDAKTTEATRPVRSSDARQ